MKTLYLIRHAKSSWKQPNLTDHDRPLNKRGKANAPIMGRRIKHKGIVPEMMISSSAKRAYCTAKKIGDEIGYANDHIVLTRDLFHADEDEILEFTRQLNDKHDSVMIFGHNPGFTWFANSLGGLSIDNIPTCGIVAFQIDINNWAELSWGAGQLLFFDYPKKQ